MAPKTILLPRLLPEGVLNAKKKEIRSKNNSKKLRAEKKEALEESLEFEATVVSTRAALNTEEARLQKFRNELCVQAKGLGFSSECELQVLENLVISAEQKSLEEKARCEKIKERQIL